MAPNDHTPTALPGDPPRILFVDDDADVRELFADSMSRRGFLVDLAESGAEAILLGEERQYSVIVTDLRMPGLDGYTVIERLQEFQPAAAFVIVTGLPEIDTERMKGLNEAVSEIVSKPWDEARMVTALSRALELKVGRPSRPADGTVLIVEEDVDEARLISGHMAGWSAEPGQVRVVGRVCDAIEVLHDEHVEVVLADLSLPDAAGLDVVRRIGVAAPGTAIVAFTGLRDDDLGLRAIQLGAQDYLVGGEMDGAALQRAVRHALERKRASQLLTHLAHRDPLTRLANRLTFRDRLAHAMAVSRRTGSNLAIAYVDLDRFKPVNDSFGHEAGDLLLQEVAARLLAAVRGSDTVARLGGDEFGIVVENVQDDAQFERVLARLRLAFEHPFMIGGEAIEMTASFGIASFPGAGNTVDDLVRAADRAMYQAKRTSGVSCEVASVAAAERETARVRFHHDLRSGVANHEFVLYFQPQYDLRTGAPVGLEALLRWRRPGGGLVAPADFVPALEDSGLIVDVGDWVLRTACRHAVDLHAKGARVRMAVNVSPVQFASGTLVDTVSRALRETGLPPDCLEIEMTERTMMRDTRAVNSALSALKDAGIRLTVDDFGTGYASLGYLNRFKVDALKIDRSFIRGIAARPRASIADAVVDVGHRLGLQVVAEGVEDDTQLLLLRERGCDLAQGFLLGMPLPSWSPAMLAGRRSIVPPIGRA
jgi:diguanylate cyclase